MQRSLDNYLGHQSLKMVFSLDDYTQQVQRVNLPENLKHFDVDYVLFEKYFLAARLLFR